MSDLLPNCQLSDSKEGEESCPRPIHELLPLREAHIGAGLIIRRALPQRERRLIGAWCFLDHFGPLDLSKGGGLNIGPHPHIGLQTFTYLLEGSILHRDSLGSYQKIQPDQVNLMTAGKGIAHSEESLGGDVLHGVQLWIALPDEVRNIAPSFNHYPELPVHQQNSVQIRVLAGEYAGAIANPKIYTPLVGLHITSPEEAEIVLPIEPLFEYGVVVLKGVVSIDEHQPTLDELLYLGCGRGQLKVKLAANTHLLLIGGEPFKEEVLVWWNFVARSVDEISEATKDWQAGHRFGEVKGYQGMRLAAPPIPWESV